MTGREITSRAIADTREAVREQNRLRKLDPLAMLAQVRAKAEARQAAGGKMAVPLALQTALAADVRTPRPAAVGSVTAPEEKTPARMRRRGKTTALGVMVRGMLNGPMGVSRAQMADPEYWAEQREREGGE